MADLLIADPTQLGLVLQRRWGRDQPVVLHPSVYQHHPCGNRLLVVLDPPPTEYGGILIPKAIQSNEMLGRGTVIAVGDTVGMTVPYPGGPSLATTQHGDRVSHPAGLLYAWLVFGAYSGKTIRLDYVQDREYESGVLLLADRDIWCVLSEDQ